MVNLLPIEMNYYFKGTEIAGTVKAGQEAQLHAVSYHYCKCSKIVSDTHCTMVNLLPIEMNYYFKGTEIAGTVKAGQEAQLHAVSNHSIGLDTRKPVFRVCGQTSLLNYRDLLEY